MEVSKWMHFWFKLICCFSDTMTWSQNRLNCKARPLFEQFCQELWGEVGRRDGGLKGWMEWSGLRLMHYTEGWVCCRMARLVPKVMFPHCYSAGRGVMTLHFIKCDILNWHPLKLSVTQWFHYSQIFNFGDRRAPQSCALSAGCLDWEVEALSVFHTGGTDLVLNVWSLQHIDSCYNLTCLLANAK